jgi:cobalt/nickel transport system permease protein
VHIPDGWIDVPTSATAAVAAAGATGVAARRAAASFRDRVTTLPAVVAAYLLVAQLLVLPVGLGTGAHLIGTGLAALLVGPAVAIVCVAAVVVVQALLLADGGVTAMGLNVLNDGVVPALVAWAGWSALRPATGSAPLAAGLAAGLSSLAAGGAVALEFVVGGTDALPAGSVAAAIGGAHVVIAVVEGVLTAAVVRLLLRQRPDLVRAEARRRPHPAATESVAT